MKYVLLTSLVAIASTFGLAAQAAQPTVDLSGAYVYKGDATGDGIGEDGEREVIAFPTTLREGDTGYYNYAQPPTPWYAKIPQDTRFTIRQEGDTLWIRHLPIEGAYLPGQVGKHPIETRVVLHSLSSGEKFRWTQDGFELRKRETAGLGLLGGSSWQTEAHVQPNGDIRVETHYTGWAIIPAPVPIHWNRISILHRLKK